MRFTLFTAFLAFFSTGWLPVAVAGSPTEAAVGSKEEFIFDKIWNVTELYHDDGNSILQDLSVTGRFHGQYHWSDGDTADDDGWETRRARIGLEAKVFNDFTVKVEMTSASNFEPSFNGFSNFAVQWHPDDAFVLTVGKQLPRFTYDYSISTNVHPYIERSQLLNQLRPDRAPAVSIQGRMDKFSYYTALVSNTPSDDLAEEFGSYDGGASFIATIGYDVRDTFHTSAADMRLEYLHSEHNERSTIYNLFDHVLATSLVLRERRVSLATEVIWGLASERGDAIGLNVMPGWFITRKLELVARYQIATSNSDTGLSAQPRYERTVDLPPGDLYQAAYAGFNYFIYGPRFRIMGGVEFADMNGHDVWTALLGVRLYWGPDAKTAFPVGYPWAKQ
jgi:phosphate-selective porin OprO and OprP